MTLGDGILWSTVLILTAAAIYQFSVRKLWNTVGKVSTVVVLIGAVVGGGFVGWNHYKLRPHIVNEIGELRLGMTPLEVTLAKGEPINSDSTEPFRPSIPSVHVWRMRWLYRPVGYDDALIFVAFGGETPDDLTTNIICQRGGYFSVLNNTLRNSEKDVVDWLGEPSNVNIAKDGLSKYISYEQWQVSYEIAKGNIRQICISNIPMTYQDEHGDEPKDTESDH